MWIALLLIGPLAGGLQLDLPRERPRPASPTPEWLDPTARGLHAGAREANRHLEARQGSGRTAGRGQLDLPPVDPRTRPQPAPPGSGEPRPAEPESAEPPAPPPASQEVPPGSDAAPWLARLAALTSSGDRAARELQQALLAGGEDAAAAARIALWGDHLPAVLLSARRLVVGGEPKDREQLRSRLLGRFPGQLGAQLLRTLAPLAPDVVTPDLLAQLLDHSQAPMRLAAERQWLTSATPADLPLLVSTLDARRAETRQRAVAVLGAISDPGAAHALLRCLSDPAAPVAAAAAQRLGAHPWPELDRLLLERALAGRVLFREQAYALLALIEREDRSQRAILDAFHVPVLLESLNSSLPVVSGAAAVALAGIGFRESDRAATRWLDLEVPHELVRILVGESFHRDFSSLEGPARRRLTLISGEDFGGDGPSWQRWWASSVRGFQARRAVLAHTPADAPGVLFLLRDAGALEELVLAGPGASHAPRSLDGTLFLSEEQARRLVAELDGLGLFGGDAPPGVHGEGAARGRMEVRLAGQGKVFEIGERGVPAFALGAAEVAKRMADENRWQRFYDGSRYDSRRAFVEAEGAWWAVQRSEAERDRRTVELALSALAGAGALERGPMVAELAVMARRDGLLRPEDFDSLVDALAVEPFWGERARLLVRLALDAAGARITGELAEPEGGEVDALLARRLVETLQRAFGAPALEALEEVVDLAPPALARTLAVDPRPLLRQVAAPVLARSARAEDVDALRRLLADEAGEVEAAAVRAVGEGGLVELRGEVLARARLGGELARPAALLALGKLGGEGALELLVASVGAARGAFDAAAAEGLGELGDERAVPVLVSLLHAGPASPAYEATRNALRKLGPVAWTEIMRTAQSPRSAGRRGAALLLAEQGVPLAVPVLLELVGEDPNDTELRAELAALTCIDFGADGDALAAYWDWWERAPRDSSLLWLRAAQERQLLPVAPVDSLRGAGTAPGAMSLVASMEQGDRHLALRARRELERLLQEPVGEPPRGALRREEWFRALSAKVEAHYAGP